MTRPHLECRWPRIAIWLAALLCTSSIPRASSADQGLSFREGVSGYAHTQDLHLTIPANFTGNGHAAGQYPSDPENPHWVWDSEATWGEGSVLLSSGANRFGKADNVGLLRFGQIFGDQPGQIPPGATITSATLQLFPDNDPFLFRKPGDPATLHEVSIDWNESTRWNDFGAQPGPDWGTDFAAPIVANTGMTSSDLSIDVTQSLTAWSQAPSSNHGWLFMPTGVEDIIHSTGSAISNVTHVRVDLAIDTPQRGEIVATLRHGNYTALLINRIGAACDAQTGFFSNDLVVSIDDDAAIDIHDSPSGMEPLTGAWKPDAACFALPLCTGGGTGGLCGQPADGDWVLHVSDEWSNGGSGANLVSWGITLSDGVNPDESHSASPGIVLPKRHVGSGYASAIWSSESPNQALRPLLTVAFEETPVFSPAPLEAHPQAGIQNVLLRIPSGSNATSDVTVTLGSDTPGVVSVPGSPVVFAAGGPESLPLALSIGQAGSARVSAANDAGFGSAELSVSVGVFGISLEPGSLNRVAGSSDESLRISIPIGANASTAVALTLSSDDPNLVSPLAGSGGSLPVVFAAGAATFQDVTVQFGSMAGSATLTVSDDAALLAGAVAPVTLGVEAPVELDLGVEPYVQLGDAPLGAATDQFVLAWQTTLREAGGENADRFTVEYRRVGDPSWIAVSQNSPIPTGSASRLTHSAKLAGLDFGEQYETRVRHLRNEVPMATYQQVVRTRGNGPLRVTAFGNTGLGGIDQELMAQVALSFDPDLHLLLGDNVYNHGEYEHLKTRVGDIYKDLMSSKVVHHTLGNHDHVIDAGQSNLDFFFEPENGPPGLRPETNYSFDYGDIHFVSVDSGGSRNAADIQNKIAPWLAADLAASSKPWKIVYTHEPPITRDPYGVDRSEHAAVRDHLLKAAVDHGAQLFLAGATHSMQRYLPITNVIATDPYVRWSSCQDGNGTTLVYPGTGAWFRPPPGPIPSTLDPPMELYAPQLGVAVIETLGTQMTISLMDENSQPVDVITINQCLTEQDCQCPSSMTLFGIAEGGYTVSIEIAGVLLSVETTNLQAAPQILALLADQANSDPLLMALGFTASASGEILNSTATIKNILITDPRISEHLGEFRLPGLSPIGMALLAAALIGGVVLASRRRG